jgi:hypothetical protein
VSVAPESDVATVVSVSSADVSGAAVVDVVAAATVGGGVDDELSSRSLPHATATSANEMETAAKR